MSRNRILMTCAIASLALGLAACSSDDKASPVAEMPAAEMPELTPLDAAKRDAAAEATAAMAAVGAADDAVEDANTARADVATMQTNGTSGGHADQARHYADIAEAERVKAMAASADAAAAEDLEAVTRALVKAENARAAADTASAEAVRHADLAILDAANELKIVGTVKSVGLGTEKNGNRCRCPDHHEGHRRQCGGIHRPVGGDHAAHAHGRQGPGEYRCAGANPTRNPKSV